MLCKCNVVIDLAPQKTSTKPRSVVKTKRVYTVVYRLKERLRRRKCCRQTSEGWGLSLRRSCAFLLLPRDRLREWEHSGCVRGAQRKRSYFSSKRLVPIGQTNRPSLYVPDEPNSLYTPTIETLACCGFFRQHFSVFTSASTARDTCIFTSVSQFSAHQKVDCAQKCGKSTFVALISIEWQRRSSTGLEDHQYMRGVIQYHYLRCHFFSLLLEVKWHT